MTDEEPALSTRLLASHTVLNGHSFLDFDGFAPAADWEEFAPAANRERQ
jgi:hypothetical protein